MQKKERNAARLLGHSLRKKLPVAGPAVLGVAFLAGTALLQAMARSSGGFATWYAHAIYPLLVGSIGLFFGLFPFSVVEIALYLLIAGCLYELVRHIRHPLFLVSRAVCLCGILLFVYTVNCGINYHAASFSEYAGWETGEYRVEELERLCEYLVEQVNATAGEIEADAGTQIGDSGTEDRAGAADGKNVADAAEPSGGKAAEFCYQGQRRLWQREGVLAMKAAAEEFAVLDGYYPRPKELAVSWILSVQQLCGIYSPFTIEANYNGKMPDYNIPHTICHELSHLRGFMREDEANFIGYLACISSDNRAFRYSGYLTGWVYAVKALQKKEPETYAALRPRLCDGARADLRENNEFWDRYDTKVAEVSSQVNDTYLKANRQEDGVQSYGRMVDLMLAYEITLHTR
ncbi:MAG: DUF3810 domain-containing protein [Clostridiales bacterium]|nr:DUF3810 domain-containing protein [Clostridiales bacterium]